jgi:nitrate reductase NapE component
MAKKLIVYRTIQKKEKNGEVVNKESLWRQLSKRNNYKCTNPKYKVLKIVLFCVMSVTFVFNVGFVVLDIWSYDILLILFIYGIGNFVLLLTVFLMAQRLAKYVTIQKKEESGEVANKEDLSNNDKEE